MLLPIKAVNYDSIRDIFPGLQLQTFGMPGTRGHIIMGLVSLLIGSVHLIEIHIGGLCQLLHLVYLCHEFHFLFSL